MQRLNLTHPGALPVAPVAKSHRQHPQLTRCIAEPAVRPAAPTSNGVQGLNGTLPLQQVGFQTPFARFQPETWSAAHKPIEEAHTPPSSWYNSPDVWEYEKEAVLRKNWLFVGHTGKLQKPGDFFTGKMGDNNFVVVKGNDGELRAFHNVCRHHAAPVAYGTGCTERFECPYHGWEYDLNGRFRGATQLKGIKGFYAEDQKLWPIRLETWGHFVFLLFDDSPDAPKLRESLQSGGVAMEEAEMEATDLVHVHQDVYDLKCNWKVYNDNYLDGCYHCTFAHPGLSAALDVAAYHNVLYEKVSFQVSPLSDNAGRPTDGQWDDIIASRVEGDGRGPQYAFVYPNVMVNRYAMWMDTLHVIPQGPDRCQVNIDYWVHKSKVDDKEWIRAVVAGEHQVQKEDVSLCDLVQEGIQSPAYDVGRYAPEPESAMWHFHQLVNKDLFATA